MIRTKTRNNEPGAVVYVVSLKGVRRKCKIGVSADVARRLKQLATGSPYEPILSYVFDAYSMELAYRAEKRVHETLKEYRTNGEWFDIAPFAAAQVVDEIVKDVLKPTRPKHFYFKVPTKGIAPKTLDEMAALNAERRKNKAA